MRLSLTTSFSLLLILAALIASIWAVFLSGSSKNASTSRHFQDLADASMENVSATVVNAAGVVSMHIESPKMMHYPKDDTTFIQEPVVMLFRHTSGPWRVSADKGFTHHGIEKIFLKKNVVVHHPSDQHDPEMKLTTESLTVFPEQEEVQTLDAVTIMQPNAIIRAVGMNANFSTGIVHLLSDTRSDYVPAS